MDIFELRRRPMCGMKLEEEEVEVEVEEEECDEMIHKICTQNSK